jgi:cytochrome b561
MEFKGIFAKGTDARDLMKTAHYAFGLSIFMLFWLRVLARSLLQTPAQTAVTSLWQRKLVALTHAALYLLMLLQPILGWLLINAEQSNTMIFGVALLPQLLTPDAALAERLEELHEIIATAGYVLIGAHSAAALMHHYYLKDATLHKMLFGNKQQR